MFEVVKVRNVFAEFDLRIPRDKFFAKGNEGGCVFLTGKKFCNLFFPLAELLRVLDDFDENFPLLAHALFDI